MGKVVDGLRVGDRFDLVCPNPDCKGCGERIGLIIAVDRHERNVIALVGTKTSPDAIMIIDFDEAEVMFANQVQA